MVRILGSIILLILVIGAVNLEDVLATLVNINIWVYLLSFVVYMGNKLISSYRWKILLGVQNIHVNLFALYKVNLLGLVFNSILPSTIGGESVRIYWLMKEYPQDKTPSIIATLADKFLGVIALVFLVFITLPFNTLIDLQLRTISMVTLGAILSLMVIVIVSPGSKFTSLLRKMMFNDWLRGKYDESIRVMSKFKEARNSVMLSFFIAVIFQSISVINQFLRFNAIGVDISLLYLFLAIPITTLIITIPISIGGLGLRELSLIGLLSIIGVGDHEVVSYTIVGYSVVLLLSIPLALLNLSGNLLQSQTEESES